MGRRRLVRGSMEAGTGSPVGSVVAGKGWKTELASHLSHAVCTITAGHCPFLLFGQTIPTLVGHSVRTNSRSHIH